VVRAARHTYSLRMVHRARQEIRVRGAHTLREVGADVVWALENPDGCRTLLLR
jgi:hypothetical protein